MDQMREKFLKERPWDGKISTDRSSSLHCRYWWPEEVGSIDEVDDLEEIATSESDTTSELDTKDFDETIPAKSKEIDGTSSDEYEDVIEKEEFDEADARNYAQVVQNINDEMMNVEVKSPESQRNLPWQGVMNPRGLVFISHGFSEHLGLYDHVADELTKAGLFVFGHDHYGHGQSSGKRAYIEEVSHYTKDVHAHCCKISEIFKNKPIFLIGHSMGGMIAVSTCLEFPNYFRAVILQGPLIIPGPSIHGYDLRISWLKAKLFNWLLWPLDMWNPEMVLGMSSVALITRDFHERRRLEADELRWQRGCKVRLLLAFIACMEHNLEHLEDFETDFLILHGESDFLCNIEGSKHLFEVASNVKDKQIQTFPEAAHQLYLERENVRSKAIESTITFIMSKT